MASLRPAFSAATSCSVARSVISLICSDFISVLLCGDLVPSPEPGEPKDRVGRRTEQTNQGAGADSNGRDTSPRVARRCASGGGGTGRTALRTKRADQAYGLRERGLHFLGI